MSTRNDEDPHVDVRTLAPGEFVPADLGLDDVDGIDDDVRAYEATAPARPGHAWVDSTPERARSGLRMLLRELADHDPVGESEPGLDQEDPDQGTLFGD